jgi:hypothetical protein
LQAAACIVRSTAENAKVIIEIDIAAVNGITAVNGNPVKAGVSGNDFIGAV